MEKSLSHTEWKCQYHIVSISKYRQKVLFRFADIRETVYNCETEDLCSGLSMEENTSG